MYTNTVMPSWIRIFGSFLPRYPTLPLRSYVFAGNWDIPDLQNLSISCAIKIRSMTFRPLPKKPDFDIQKLMDSMCFNIDGTAGLISEEQLSRTFHYLDSDCPIYVWAPADLRLSSAITLKTAAFHRKAKCIFAGILQNVRPHPAKPEK